MQAVLDITKTIKEEKSVKHRRNEDKTCILYNMIVLIKKLRIYISDLSIFNENEKAMFNDKKQKNSHIVQKCTYKIRHNYKK